MKKIIFLLFIHICTFSQTAFHNFGNVQMHTSAEIGLHTNLVNDGNFDSNLGFTGFYSENEILTVSGDNKAVFNNVDVDVINNLELYTAMGVTNDFLFINGKIITPRTDIDVSLDFINFDVYAGEGDLTHVDGYTSIIGNEEFIFPIGDDNRFRPMITPIQDENTFLKGAYFYEDPNTPNTFSTNFITSQRSFEIKNVSSYEFWDLNGDTNTNVTLTWDNLSNIEIISPDFKDLIIVGWSKQNNRWDNLGNTGTTGDFNSGSIKSSSFIPNDYEVITFGNLRGEIDNNYYISPNGDEYSEFLIFEELEFFSNSELLIFNRWGVLVFSASNYENNFNGISQVTNTILKERGLPVGTYFYELKYGDNNLNKFKKGWVYIHR